MTPRQNPKFSALVPPLSTADLEALRLSIERDGVLVPIDVDENGDILDGNHRFQIAGKKCPVRVVKGLSEAQKTAHVLRSAFARRNLSPDQRRELDKVRKQTASALRKENYKHWTQPRLAKELGVDQATISRWTEDITNMHVHNGYNPKVQKGTAKKKPPRESRHDARVKVTSSGVATIVERVDRGDSQTQIAADLGITQPAVSKIVNQEARKKAKTQGIARLAKDAEPDPASAWRIENVDCLVGLKKLDDESINLVFADPPYNIGIDYGEGKGADSLSDSRYMKWVERWIAECVRVLVPGGSAWFMIGDEYAGEYAVTIKAAGLHVRNWIKWYETFGVNCTNKFSRCSRHIFYCTKSEKGFTFNKAVVSRQSARQVVYNDSRANDGGKLWDDVWIIPRLVGTAKERIPDFPTQLPVELLGTIIACSSRKADIVLDPFCGSGTTAAAAILLKREFIGFEKSKTFCDMATLRIRAKRDVLSASLVELAEI